MMFPNWLKRTPGVRHVPGPSARGGRRKPAIRMLCLEQLEDRTLPSVLSGQQFEDLNNNRLLDAGESALAGWTIFLDQNNNAHLDQGEISTQTNDVGAYTFVDLTSGSYIVRQVLRGGWQQTFPQGPTQVDDPNPDNVDDDGDGFALDDCNDANRSINPGAVEVFNGIDDNCNDQVDEAFPFPFTPRHVVPLGSGQTATGINFGNRKVAVTPGQTLARIEGMVFEDPDSDGFQDAGEAGLGGWTVYLDEDNDGRLDDLEVRQQTTSGPYAFTNLAAGTYVVRQVPQDGWTQTAPAGGSFEVTVAAGEIRTGLNFANFQLQTLAGIEGAVFEDLDGDGFKDAGEAGVGGWTIYLDEDNNGQLDDLEARQQTTSGPYAFTNLAAGTYVVRQVPQDGWTQTAPAGGSFEVTVAAGETRTGLNFASFQPRLNTVVLSGQQFEDLNNNRLLDAGESGLAGWTIFLDQNNNAHLDQGEISTQTNDVGAYAFVDLTPGSYIVRQVPREGWQQTFPQGPTPPVAPPPDSVDHDGDGFALDDCNDADNSINPGAADVFNGIDDNCNDQVDEAFPFPFTPRHVVPLGSGRTATGINFGNLQVGSVNVATTPEDVPVLITPDYGTLQPPGGALTAIISVAPLHGKVTLLNSSLVEYTPQLNFHGVDSFSVTLIDLESSGAIGGATIDVQITSVNDPPSFNGGPDQFVPVNAGLQTRTNWATNLSRGPADEAGQGLTFELTTTNNSLFATPPAVDAAGTLTYAFAPGADGWTRVTARLRDDGGIDNGGQDKSAPRSFILTTDAVNNAPSASPGPDITVNEDAGPQTMPGWLTAISPGPANETGQAVVVSLPANLNVASQLALFSSLPAIDPSGMLTFTPAANATGTALLTLRLQDDGGTANGGTNFATRQFRITLQPVNDAPQAVSDTALTAPGDAIVIGVLANDTDPEGDTLSLIGAGPAALGSVAINADRTLTYSPTTSFTGSDTFTYTVSDGRGGLASAGVIVTFSGVTPTHTTVEGQPIQVSIDVVADSQLDPGDVIQILHVIPPSHGALTSLGGVTYLYTPAADFHGLDTIQILGVAGIHSVSGTATIRVLPVNDVPSFLKGPNQSIDEDAGAQVVPGWASAMRAGPVSEVGQNLTFLVTTDNAGLFAAGPAVDAGGQLTYTPNPHATGSATVTVRLQDSGGVTNGGVDTTAPVTFTITIIPVNDVPFFDAIAPQTLDEDAAVQTVSILGVMPGPTTATDEAAQTVTLTVTSSNPGLILNPTISGTTLTYQPVANAFGTSTITVAGNDGQSVNNTFMRTFVITVNPVNDAPLFVAIPAQTVAEDAGVQSLPISGVLPGPATATDEASQIVTFTATSSNPALIPNPTISGTGTTRTLNYQPAANANGIATITLTASDGQNANAVFSRTFTVTVISLRDADLSVVMTQSSNPAGRDRDQTYTITANNAGPEAVNFVIVEATIPAGTTFKSMTGAFSFSRTSVRARWQLGTLVAGAQVVLTMTVTVKSTAPATISSLATISNAAQEIDSGNNSFTLAAQVVDVGTFTVTTPATADPETLVPFTLAWTVPSGSWHDLKTVDLRLRTANGTLVRVRFNEADNSLRLFDPLTGRFGRGAALGSARVLANAHVQIRLASATVQSAGPSSPTFALHLDLVFRRRASARNYRIEVAATDDLGNRQGFAAAGVIRLTYPELPKFLRWI